MAKIKKIKGRQVFDSRGNPTVEAEIFSDNGRYASAIVPSGASTGTYEAYELRDKDNKNYLGKSVFKAVENINGQIAKALQNLDINDQKKIDKTLIELDGTEQKKKPGANAILAVSIASCKLAAIAVGVAAVFMETHPDPDNAPSDGPNMVPLSKMPGLLKQLVEIDKLIKNVKN